MAVSKRPDDPDQRFGSVSSNSSQAGQGDPHYNAPIAMYPFMFQAPFTPAVPYMLDSSFLPGAQTGSGSPLTPFAPQYPIFGTLYQTPPSPALTSHNSYSPSRTFSGAAERADARRQNAMRMSRSTYHSTTTHHNHVDINRIRDGIDVRTTVGSSSIYLRNPADFFPADYASQHSQQGRSSHA